MKNKSVRVIELEIQQADTKYTNWNDWVANKKVSIDINEIWISDIFEMDNEKCNACEMDNRRLKLKRGVVRFIKAQITPTESNRH